MRRLISILCVVLITIAIPFTVFAHSGRTDSKGGHYNRKTGEYHYHNSGYSSSSSSSYSYTTRTRYATKVYVKNIPSTIYAGEGVKLSASVYPSDAIDDDVTWSSSDTSVAKVDSYGNLEAVGIGTAVIKAETYYGTKSQYTIVVKERFAESIEILEKPKSLKLDEETTLSVKFNPDNTTNKEIKWKSKNEKVATISSEGELCAVGLGKTTITAEHNELKDSFVLEVLPIETEKIRSIFQTNSKRKQMLMPCL